MTSADSIRNLLSTYCELVDSGDSEGLADLLADAELATLDGQVWGSGRDGVLSVWWPQIRLYDGSPRTQHVTANPVIEVDESAGTATCRSSYVVFQAAPRLPLQPIITGRYHDTFARGDDGAWRFTQRRYGISLTGDLSHHLGGPIG